MGTPMRIATYALALVVVFIAAWEIGSRVRPMVGHAARGPTTTASTTGHGQAGHADESDHTEDCGQTQTTTPRPPQGLASKVDGYRVHPNGHPGDGTTPAGPGIDFVVDVPTAGTYRLFLDFSHGGVVRTAPFVLTVAG